MERLTKKYEDGHYGLIIPADKCDLEIKWDAYDRLGAYEDLEITPEQVKELDAMYRKKCEELSKYQRLENDGLLFTLPCKPGDRTYQIVSEYERRDTGCTSCTTMLGSNVNCAYYDTEKETCTNCTADKHFQIISRGFHLSDYYNFGKTVFLSPEQAEHIQSEMEGNITKR